MWIAVGSLEVMYINQNKELKIALSDASLLPPTFVLRSFHPFHLRSIFQIGSA